MTNQHLPQKILCSFLFYLFFATGLSAQRQNLLHENTFEESTTNDAYLHGYINNQHCCSYSVQRSNEITGIGSYSLRLEVRSTDAQTSNSIRSEIVPDDESYALDKDRWYGFKMYLKDWDDDNDVQEHVWQWHPDDSGSPAALSLWTGAGRFQVVTNNNGSNNIYTDIGPILSDQWVDFVIHVRWDDDNSNNTGLLEIWMNGTKVINRHNVKTAFIRNYFKLGINKFGWPGGSITNRTLFFDEVRIGNESATYNDVAPPSTTPSATATIDGKIETDALPSAPNDLLEIPLQVKLYTASNSTLAASYNITTSRNGRFVISGITPGTYHIAVKNSKTLQRINLSQVLSAGYNNVVFQSLLSGDANNDNTIDGLDGSILLNSYNLAITDIGYDARADFNGDDYVDLLDFGAQLLNFYKEGESITTGCPLVTATISIGNACNGLPVNLSLTSATGTSPFDLVINGNTYSNVNVSDVITVFSPPKQSIWTSAPGSTPSSYSASNVELGAKFQFSHSGYVNGVRFFSADAVSGIYTGNLWSSNGTLLATATFSSVTATGWQEVLFSSPVYVTANTTYTVSYHTTGKYVATLNAFCSAGMTNGNVVLLSNTAANGNGVYKFGNSAFPDQTSNCSNYWVDVLFTSDVPYTYSYNLTSVTDNGGCNNTRDMQTLSGTSTTCGARAPITTPPVAQTALPESNFKNSLGQNYPNPVDHHTIISYSVAEAGQVKLDLYDINGRPLKALVNEWKEAGSYTINVARNALSPGTYFYKIKTGGFNSVRKMIIK